jgi:hypothetical protein
MIPRKMAAAGELWRVMTTGDSAERLGGQKMGKAVLRYVMRDA